MRRRLVTALAAVVLVGAACSEDDPGEATHPMLEDPTPTATPTSTGTPAGAEPTEAAFPQECGQLIPFVRVAEIMAVPMAGTSRVYQDDFPADSGRLERLTCSYGTESPDDDGDAEDGDGDEDAEDGDDREPYVTIAVSSYTDPGAATVRVDSTVDSARVGGQQVEAMELAGRSGFILRGDETVSYVVADQELTYVVTLRRDVLDDPAEQVVLVTMVEQLLSPSQ
ncbi:MAG TPA: hypothetical protein VFZ85_09020 [Jiangellaceae bacterium]